MFKHVLEGRKVSFVSQTLLESKFNVYYHFDSWSHKQYIFHNSATQGTPQMTVDKRLAYLEFTYIRCDTRPHEIFVYSVLEHINSTLLTSTQSQYNSFHSFEVLRENGPFLTSSLLCSFTNGKSCLCVIKKYIMINISTLVEEG